MLLDLPVDGFELFGNPMLEVVNLGIQLVDDLTCSFGYRFWHCDRRRRAGSDTNLLELLSRGSMDNDCNHDFSKIKEIEGVRGLDFNPQEGRRD